MPRTVATAAIVVFVACSGSETVAPPVTQPPFAEPARNIAFIWSRASGFVELPRPAGAAAVFPSAINDAGQVAGVAISLESEAQAFLWTSAAGYVFLNPPLSYESSYARAINEQGAITGSIGDRAFVWDAKSGLQRLEIGSSAIGVAINSAGDIAGSMIEGTAGARQRAFRWSPRSGLEVLPVETDNHSYVRDMNDAGFVLGSEGKPGGMGGFESPVTVLWTNSGNRSAIGDCAQDCTRAFMAINDNGLILGNRLGRAFRWTAADGFENAPAVFVGSAINDKGDVAGYSSPFDSVNRGVLWTASGDVIDMGLPPNATSVRPAAINNAGQVVGVAR